MTKRSLLIATARRRATGCDCGANAGSAQAILAERFLGELETIMK